MKLLNSKVLLITSVSLFFGLLLSGSGSGGGEEHILRSSPSGDPFFDAGCTVVYGADEKHAFGGNNEDSQDPKTMVWFLPAEDGDFGRILFGYEQFVWQGGMNDQGLFFDAMVGDQMIHVPQGDKERYPGSLPSKALASCADVPCVIQLFEDYHAYDDWVFQFMFGDAHGKSVIIEPNVIQEGGAPFQVATNFYQSLTDIKTCRFCTRYWTARNLFEKGESLTVEVMRDIMDAVHLEDDYPTQYTTIYDLKQGLIYLYHFHNYTDVVVFDLDEELAKGYHAQSLIELFPENPDFLEWAQPELDRIASLREAYTTVELGPIFYLPLLGDYIVPEGLDAPSAYYSIDIEHGGLVLKMLPDKAWLELEPTSETEFFHASGISQFEITFLSDENGDVNSFNYHYQDQDYLFQRSSAAAEEAEEVGDDSVDRPQWEQSIQKIAETMRSNTVRFLGIVLGLVILQVVLGYLRSLLV